MFCPSGIGCFDVVTQEQAVVAVSRLQCVDWNKTALGQLVVPKEKKEIICCLLQNHGKETVKHLTNLIPGKGSVRSFLPLLFCNLD
jgi:hypothetical protein